MQIVDHHVSGQTLIKQHSDLNHRYMGRFNFVRLHHTIRSFPGFVLDVKNYYNLNSSIIYSYALAYLTATDQKALIPGPRINLKVLMASDPRVHVPCPSGTFQINFKNIISNSAI